MKKIVSCMLLIVVAFAVRGIFFSRASSQSHIEPTYDYNDEWSRNLHRFKRSTANEILDSIEKGRSIDLRDRIVPEAVSFVYEKGMRERDPLIQFFVLRDVGFYIDRDTLTDLRIQGIRVRGEFNIYNVRADTVEFQDVALESPVSILRLACVSCKFLRVSCSSSFVISHSSCNGPLVFEGIKAKSMKLIDLEVSDAISLRNTDIEGDLVLSRLTTEHVDLRGIKVGGLLDLAGLDPVYVTAVYCDEGMKDRIVRTGLRVPVVY